MTPFDFAIYACCLCGLSMVIGAIALLGMRVIKLSEVGKAGGAFSLEVEKKIKIATAYPALGLFLIGLLFMTLGIYFSKPSGLEAFSITGKLNIDDPTAATVTIEPDSSLNFTPDGDGTMDKVFQPQLQRMRVLITANGHTPAQYRLTLNLQDAGRNKQRLQLNFPPTLRFTKVNERPAQGTITALPASVSLPPLTQSNGFNSP